MLIFILPDRLMVSRACERRLFEGMSKGSKIVFSAAGSSNGRTSGFGPEYLGSSPSPAALNGNFPYSYLAHALARRTSGFGPEHLPVDRSRFDPKNRNCFLFFLVPQGLPDASEANRQESRQLKILKSELTIKSQSPELVEGSTRALVIIIGDFVWELLTGKICKTIPK